MLYTKVSNNEDANIAVFLPGRPLPLVAHSSHPNWDEIIEQVEADDEDGLVELFDLAEAAAVKFREALSDRVSVDNGTVYLDGDPVDNALTNQVLRFLQEDVDDWAPLVNFFEKVQANPNEHSREQLYEWITRHALTITEEGDIVAYKGVTSDNQGNLVSQHSGSAIVNGKPLTGRIPNAIGSTIEMARSTVQHDPSTGCSTGLHVGTYEYAQSYSRSGALLEVRINPRDVVSVPSDCSHQKMRVCRYTVVKAITDRYSTAVRYDGADEDDTL